MQENRLKFELWFHVWTSTFHQRGLSIGARPNSLSARLQTQVLSHIFPKVEVTSNKNVNEMRTFLFVATLYQWKDGKFVNHVDHFWFRLLILWSGNFLSSSEYCFQNFRAFLVRWIKNSSLYYLFLIGTNVNQAVSE